MIRFACHGCHTSINAPDDKAGRTAVCPKCGQHMQIPPASRPPTSGHGSAPVAARVDAASKTRPSAGSGTEQITCPCCYREFDISPAEKATGATVECPGCETRFRPKSEVSPPPPPSVHEPAVAVAVPVESLATDTFADECVSCGLKMRLPDSYRGKPFQCPVCHVQFTPGLRSAAGSPPRQSDPADDARRGVQLPPQRPAPPPLISATGRDIEGAEVTVSGRMRPCPYCAEEIRVEAIKCRHCGESLVDQPGRRATSRTWPRIGGRRQPGRTVGRLIGIILMVIGALGFVGSCNMDTTVAVDPVPGAAAFGISLPSRVHNIGLMEQRREGMVLCGVMFLVGLVLANAYRFMPPEGPRED